MLIAFLIILTTIVVILFISKPKYKDYLSNVDKNIYKMKELMPIPLLMFNSIRYGFNTGYDNLLEVKLGEIYGTESARYNLKLYWSNKIALIIVVLLVGLFFGTLMEPVDSGFTFFLITAVVLSFYLPDKELKEKIKRRHLQMQIDFPEFLNKLALLVNAGMTVSGAIEKISTDARNTGVSEKRILYCELEKTSIEIRLGKSEVKAYEDFAKRCRLPEITRFTSILIQNLKKGNSELVAILRLQSAECWYARKNTARILGEEAETKLLFPMMLMLLAILIIVIAPSAMQLRGM
ncbi:MAG: type II secretion system F family protein [Ignavibacteriales bacterium]